MSNTIECTSKQSILKEESSDKPDIEQEINERFKKISISHKPRFVINSIKHANQDESENSSVNGDDSSDSENSIFNFDVNNAVTFPYRAFTFKREKKNSGSKTSGS